jgi:hypothetical protein
MLTENYNLLMAIMQSMNKGENKDHIPQWVPGFACGVPAASPLSTTALSSAAARPARQCRAGAVGSAPAAAALALGCMP